MKIAFDQHTFLMQRFGGISRYVCMLAKTLNGLQDTQARIFAPLHINHYLGAGDCGASGKRNIKLPQKGLRGPLRKLTFATSGCLAQRRIERFHPHLVHQTYYAERARRLQNIPHVISVLDMIHELYPQEFGKQDPAVLFKKQNVADADRILCISDSTRNDLIRLFNVPEDKATTVHLGFSPLAKSPRNNHPLGDKPYLLFVGPRGGYKNFSTLLSAFAQISRQHSDLRLICFGGGPFSDAEWQLARELKIAPERLQQRAGNDEQLAWHYQNAALFVYPSRYEGFGIPPLEAMSLGCPVIASNSSSIPEVVGDAAATFSPDEPEELAHCLTKLLDSEHSRTQLVDRGHARTKQFTWEACAEKTRAVYQEVV